MERQRLRKHGSIVCVGGYFVALNIILSSLQHSIFNKLVHFYENISYNYIVVNTLHTNDLFNNCTRTTNNNV